MDKKFLKIGEVSKFLNVSQKTLRRWEKDGKIKVFYTPSDQRRYEKDYIEKFLNDKNENKL